MHGFPRFLFLIGMSGAGKSTLARRIAAEQEYGYRWICVDEEIKKRLGVEDVAEWLGQPFMPRYATNSAIYKALEQEIMIEILTMLSGDKRLVVDTTGSFIYVEQRILKALMARGTFVHIETPQVMQDEMCRLYCSDPKPVIWPDGVYAPKAGEAPMDAVIRCYPDLLKSRNPLYAEFGGKPIDCRHIRRGAFNVDLFMRWVIEKE